MTNPVKVLVQYCGSWGYKNLFVRIANQLKQSSRTDFVIQGMIYPAPPYKVMAAQFLSWLFFFGLFLSFAGEWFFTNVVKSEQGMRLVGLMKNNQMACFLVFFICNTISTNMLNTGAFEVYYDEDLVCIHIHSVCMFVCFFLSFSFSNYLSLFSWLLFFLYIYRYTVSLDRAFCLMWIICYPNLIVAKHTYSANPHIYLHISNLILVRRYQGSIYLVYHITRIYTYTTH